VNGKKYRFAAHLSGTREYSGRGKEVKNFLRSSVLSKKFVMVLGIVSPEVSQCLMDAGACGVCQVELGEDLALRSSYGLTLAALLTRESARRIGSRKFLQDVETVLLPTRGALLRGIFGLARYGLRRNLVFGGLIRIDGSRLAIFHTRFSGRDKAPSSAKPRCAKEIAVAISGLDAVMLHDVDAIEPARCPPHVDVLASKEAAERIRAILAETPAVPPIRIFTADGSGGLRYWCVPYLPPLIGKQVIETAVRDRNGTRVPSIEWRLACRAFRLMFIDSAGIPPGTERLSDAVDSKCFDELARYAADAGHIAPTTFSDIEKLLEEKCLLPALDGYGARCEERNFFLRERYWKKARRFNPGLSVVMVRNFGIQDRIIHYVREDLIAAGFQINGEKSVVTPRDDIALLRIRGGEWSDENVPGGWAPMVHAFICFDPRHRPPTPTESKLNFRLDNGRAFEFKKRIRQAIGKHLGINAVNGSVHSTDNSAEAVDCTKILGMQDHGEIGAILQDLELIQRKCTSATPFVPQHELAEAAAFSNRNEVWNV
jgi:hypothetical protein